MPDERGDLEEREVDERQPEHFPMPFEEWAGTNASAWRFLIAAFRQAVRKKGQLQHQRLATEWAADFEAFRTTPVDSKE